MNDLFSAQPLIITRLSEQMSELHVVRGARDLASLRERSGRVPAAYVLYDGQEALIGAGQAQRVAQKWLVVAVVRHARDLVFGQGERQEAGVLLLRICQTILGWQPGPEHGALAMSHAPAPSFNEGFGFYPLRFMTRIVLRSD